MTEPNSFEGDEVRQAFLRSRRYRAWVTTLDIMAVARTPAMHPEQWSQEDRDAAIAWARGERDEIPEPMREYERQVKART